VEPNIQNDHRFELVKLDDALNSADVLAILVKHRQFVDAEKMGKFDRNGIVDFCGLVS
jgi:UDP-N-acetyl-D-mannosaminuronic acid dehydrogenase